MIVKSLELPLQSRKDFLSPLQCQSAPQLLQRTPLCSQSGKGFGVACLGALTVVENETVQLIFKPPCERMKWFKGLAGVDRSLSSTDAWDRFFLKLLLLYTLNQICPKCTKKDYT